MDGYITTGIYYILITHMIDSNPLIENHIFHNGLKSGPAVIPSKEITPMFIYTY